MNIFDTMKDYFHDCSIDFKYEKAIQVPPGGSYTQHSLSLCYPKFAEQICRLMKSSTGAGLYYLMENFYPRPNAFYPIVRRENGKNVSVWFAIINGEDYLFYIGKSKNRNLDNILSGVHLTYLSFLFGKEVSIFHNYSRPKLIETLTNWAFKIHSPAFLKVTFEFMTPDEITANGEKLLHRSEELEWTDFIAIILSFSQCAAAQGDNEELIL